MKLALVIVLCSAATAAADPSDVGGLVGVVKDRATDAGLKGVAVVVSGPALDVPATAITDATGAYRVAHLPPATTYTVRFDFNDNIVELRNVQVVAAQNAWRTVFFGAPNETITLGCHGPQEITEREILDGNRDRFRWWRAHRGHIDTTSSELVFRSSDLLAR